MVWVHLTVREVGSQSPGMRICFSVDALTDLIGKGGNLMVDRGTSGHFGRAKEWVRGGFATPTHNASRQLAGTTFVERASKDFEPAALSGCIYREDGTKVALSERFGGWRGDLYVSRNPDLCEPPVDAQRVAGRALYLGHHMGRHYGHFITEGLSTFWIFEEHDPAEFDHFVFHPFAFAATTSAHMRYCLEEFGIPEDKIVVVGSDFVRFDELLVPERLFRIGDAADPTLHRVYERLTGGPGRTVAGKRIYLSRRKFCSPGGERVVANELLIEKLFQNYGFTVVFPEQLSFREQLELFSSAECIAGVGGSSMHNSVFMNPGTTTIELGDPRYEGPNPSQPLCDAISGVRSEFIPFEGRRFGARMTMLFSLDAIERGIRKALDLNGVETESRRSHSGPLDLIRVGYRAVRPPLGHLVRKVVPQ